MPELPPRPLVLDLGCGPGSASTLVARETGGRVVGLDLHRPFLRDAREKARRDGLDARVAAVQADMEAPPFVPGTFDAVWSEGALYSVGFARGLEIGRGLLKPGGYLVATEAVWLEAEPPLQIRRWWEGEYPALAAVDANLELIAGAGLSVLEHFTLPERAWWEYYGPLESRLEVLRQRYAAEPLVLEVLAEAQVEVDMYRRFGRSYGYELFVCRRPWPA